MVDATGGTQANACEGGSAGRRRSRGWGDCPVLRPGFVLAALLCAPWVSQARTSILHPLNGSAVSETGGTVVGFCDDEERLDIDVRLNGRSHVVELWDGVFEIDLDWQEGANVLVVDGTSVSFVSDPYAETLREPTVHQAMLDNCANCHRLGRSLDLSLREQANSLCSGCHAGHPGPEAHGGAACLSCHAPHSSWEPALVRAPGDAACVACHPSGYWRGPGTAHGEVGASLGCTRCHAPHSPRLEESPVCTDCHGQHAGQRTGHEGVACHTCHWMHRQERRSGYKEPAVACGGCHALPDEAAHQDMLGECSGCHAFHGGDGEPVWTARNCAPCHPTIDAHPDYHGDAPMNECNQCHAAHDPRNLSAALAGCGGCHPSGAVESAHPEPTPGSTECLLCHRIHGPVESGLLPSVQSPLFRDRACRQCHGHPAFGGGKQLPGRWGDLCLGCHGDLGAASSHAPARDGRCEACHLAHGGEVAHELRAADSVLCLGCHPGISGWAVSAVAGDPARLGCTECHAPHGGNGPAHLRAPGRALCLGCHPDPAVLATGDARPYVHGPLNAGECTPCHAPHLHGSRQWEGDTAGQLCRSCHDSSVAAGGREHLPAASGRCTACHDPHAASGPALLRSDGDELCLACHDTSRHTHRLSLAGSGPRVHVPADRVADGGRLVCRGCHDPHASGRERLLSEDRGELCSVCH